MGGIRHPAVLLLVAGCGAGASTVQPSTVGCNGWACDLALLLPALGLHPVENLACPAEACRAEGAGGIVQGSAYRYDTGPTVLVYRAYDSPRNRVGRWWSLTPPAGGPAQYRTRYEVCAVRNQLTERMACPLRPGAVVIVGHGQSARCPDGTSYGTSPALQAWIAAPARDVDLDHCHPVSWAP